MIPIQFKGNERETVNRLYHDLLDRKPKRGDSKRKEYFSKLREIDSWCKSNISIDGQPCTFSQIIQADFRTIQDIAEKYLKGPKLPEPYKEFIIGNLYEYRFPRQKFIDALEVKVCPYCNRNFVNSASNRTMCELDHFYDKQNYPILAVSFYNLVPVCHSCNHAKGQEAISYSPHDKRYSTNDLLTFEFNITGMDFMTDEKQIEIEISDNAVISGNVEKLKLRDVYRVHSDLVQECIKKAVIFNPDYLEYLYLTYGELFESKDELYRTVFGNYPDESSYGKRPLAKLTADIMKDLLNLYYGLGW